MKKAVLILISLFMLASLVCFAAGMPKFAEHQRITFNNPMVLGTSQLPAGTYKVDHLMQG